MLEADAGKPTEAIADFQQAVKYDSSYAAAYLALGSLYNSSGRFDDALLSLGEAERLAASAWLVYFEMARADIGKGKFAEALRNIDRSSDLQGGVQKEAPELHLVRGYALIGLNEMPRAANELQTFLAHEPRGELADRARIILDKLRATTITASQ
jgi:tetratricopeptide (TPR) repeat protein